MGHKKINNTRVIPVTAKIITIFTIFILLSNFSTNYINLKYNQTIQTDLLRQLLAKDLKNIFSYSNNQFEIFQYTGDKDASLQSIEKKGVYDFKNQKSILLGLNKDGSFLFEGTKANKQKAMQDKAVLQLLLQNQKEEINEGLIDFTYNNEKYTGIYKYNSQWDTFIIRGEEKSEFYKNSRSVYKKISIMIFVISLFCAIVGIFLLKFILRYIKILSHEITKMIKSKELGLIDLSEAPNDDITFLGTAFNTLSSTINNLVEIFKKFVNQDIVAKAYTDKDIKLEGEQKDLTILFSDIKSFTFITEILGEDIIKLLNLHYDRSIREIINHDGVIGSIIGDAILSVYGVVEDSVLNKSYQAVVSAYKLQDLAAELRQQMTFKKEQLKKEHKRLSEEEEKVYQAVMLQIGVGVDGGKVFYGNIGSWVRMTNTVIGDRVNSASRLEGLTRVYKVPVICSEYVKNDIEENVKDHGFTFIEIDTVQVKGKTIGQKIYLPLTEEMLSARGVKKNIKNFSEGLQEYYAGEWPKALKHFEAVKHPIGEEFVHRIENKNCPKKWNGIWEMKTK